MKLSPEIPSAIMLETQEAKHKSNIRFIRRLLGILIGFVLIYWFVSKSNLEGIWKHIVHIDGNFAFIIGVSFLSYLLVSIAWMQCFYEKPEKLSIFRLFTEAM